MSVCGVDTGFSLKPEGTLNSTTGRKSCYHLIGALGTSVTLRRVL